MTKFNPDLIAKARKGEIAILNDGSVEDMRKVLKECWPADKGWPNADYKYYYSYLAQPDKKFWSYNNEIHLPAHSVKDFFMNTSTVKIDLTDNTPLVIPDQPRTYRVTRQQMKEIWDLARNETAMFSIANLTSNRFGAFANEVELSEIDVYNLLNLFDGNIPNTIRKIFSSYFCIPEKEPVLCRDNDGDDWVIGISDGNGGAYQRGKNYGGSTNWKQIIPYTKQPPK